MGLVCQNPGIHTSYHFNVFRSKMTIKAKWKILIFLGIQPIYWSISRRTLVWKILTCIRNSCKEMENDDKFHTCNSVVSINVQSWSSNAIINVDVIRSSWWSTINTRSEINNKHIMCYKYLNDQKLPMTMIIKWVLWWDNDFTFVTT